MTLNELFQEMWAAGFRFGFNAAGTLSVASPPAPNPAAERLLLDAHSRWPAFAVYAEAALLSAGVPRPEWVPPDDRRQWQQWGQWGQRVRPTPARQTRRTA